MRWCIAETCCVALVVAVAAAGCGSDPEPKPEPKPEPTRLQITVSATDDVNPDANGAPSPIVMRLYLLRGSSAFAAAEFFALWGKEEAVLARDLVSREEMVIRPGQTTALKSTVDPDARLVAIAAAYQGIDHATWRAMAPLSPAQTNTFKVQLSRGAVILQPVPRKDGTEKPADDKNKKEEK